MTTKSIVHTHHNGQSGGSMSARAQHFSIDALINKDKSEKKTDTGGRLNRSNNQWNISSRKRSLDSINDSRVNRQKLLKIEPNDDEEINVDGDVDSVASSDDCNSYKSGGSGDRPGSPNSYFEPSLTSPLGLHCKI